MTHSDVRKISSKRKVKGHFDEFSLWADKNTDMSI